MKVNYLNTKTEINMKTLEIPAIPEIWQSISDMFLVYNSLKKVRSIQNEYRKTPSEALKQLYEMQYKYLTENLNSIEKRCTSFALFDEFLKIKLEESKRIDIIERKELNNKETIKAICRNHYTNVNQGVLLAKLVDRVSSGFFCSIEYEFCDNWFIVCCTKQNYVRKLYYYYEN